MDYLWLIFNSLSLIRDEKHYILMAFKSMGTGGLWEPATSLKFGCSILPWILGGDFKSDYGYLGLPWGLLWWLSGKEPTYQCKRLKSRGFNPWLRKILWRRAWQPTPVFLAGESHGQRSLEGYSSCDRRVRHDSVTKQQHCSKGSKCKVLMAKQESGRVPMCQCSFSLINFSQPPPFFL